MTNTRIVRWVLAFMVVTLASVVGIAGQGEAIGTKLAVVEFPAGPGRAIAERRCSRCHTTDRILRTRYTRDEWARAIDGMKFIGLVISSEEERVLADYLGEHFGPNSAPPGPPEAPAAATAGPPPPDAQDVGPLRKLFDAGKYQEIAAALPAEPSPQALFIAAQSQLKLGSRPEALRAYRRLVALPESDAWHFIGIAGEQLIINDETTNEREWRMRLEAAIESAQRGAQMRPDLLEAHYQLGLMYAHRSNWPDAADAFDRASALNPAHAYAHYHAGSAAYHASRGDKAVAHLEAFLKLAPEAPERPEVMQILKTARGN